MLNNNHHALGVYSGLRNGEIAGLTISALDFDREIIRVDQTYDGKMTKGRRTRFAPMPAELAAILRNWLWVSGAVGGIKRLPGNLVVLREGDEPITRGTDLATKARRACKRARIEDYIPFHGTRHTAGSHWAEVAPLSKVGELLGHEEAKTTQRYSHLDTGHIAREPRMKLSFEEPSNDATVVAFAHQKKN